MSSSCSVGGLGSCRGGRKKDEDCESSRESEESVSMLTSLSRWLLLPGSRAESGGLQELWGGEPLPWKRLALRRASSMVLSCRARWQWASSWLDDGEAAARRGGEDSEGREMGREGQGMEMGALRLSLLGGEEEGSLSFGRLIQDAVTGMLSWRTRGAECWGWNRGGGGRGGGERGRDSAEPLLCLLLSGLPRQRRPGPVPESGWSGPVPESPSLLEAARRLLRRSSRGEGSGGC